MLAAMRMLVVIAVVLGCKGDDKRAPPPPVAPPSAVAADGAVAPGQCERIELERASKILADATHPCRAPLDAVYGRMVATGVAFSGTLVTTAPARGAGLVITCQHCTGADGGGLRDPEREDPSTFQVRAPAKLAAGRVASGRESELWFVYRLFSREPPRSAYDAKGHLVHILPADDFVIGTLSGAPVEVVGHLGALPSAQVSDADVALHDPRDLAPTAGSWGEAKSGTQALVLGFPRDLEDKEFEGELVVSVGEILDDTRAKDLLARSDPDEAAIPYDPAVELVVAARATTGMSGGATFAEDGRYLGVNVRATVRPVDGLYLVRVVRASYVMKQLAAALDAAPERIRAKVKPFLP